MLIRTISFMQILRTILIYGFFIINVSTELVVFEASHILELVEDFNVFVGLNYDSNDTLENLSWLFKNETIKFGILLDSEIHWNDPMSVENSRSNFALYLKKEKDRKCLLQAHFKYVPKALALPHDHTSLSDMVNFVNDQCFYFVDMNGHLNEAGIFRKYIVNDLYHVQNDENVCERIDVISKEDFVYKYLIRGKPVIIENAINDWPAMSKWTKHFLRENYGKERVHIKLTGDGEFEGCDRAEKFSNYDTFKVPDEVIKNLKFPDLVVVRPAVADLLFSKFLDIIENRNNTFANISAYLEYSSVREHFKDLENDLREFDLVKNVLKLRHLNIWLSNGNTLGKLHFDPFDNFLCQLRGEKHVTLYDPHDNRNLYEAHIQEALLSYRWEANEFHNSQLLDSTSMVMSPVDIRKPNLDRFPKFAKARPLKCRLNEGDVLFMPSFWWHEVQSKPNVSEKRNLAINFWYEPFFTKEFPCEECRLDVNPFYRTLLTKLALETL